MALAFFFSVKKDANKYVVLKYGTLRYKKGTIHDCLRNNYSGNFIVYSGFTCLQKHISVMFTN